MKRIDAIVLQIIVTEYDAAGVPINEDTSQPLKVFLPNLDKVIAQAKAELEKPQQGG